MIKSKKIKLLHHEQKLLDKNLIENSTHKNSTSVWLSAKSSIPNDFQTTVYRVMGDIELLYLLEHNYLPDTQPYQAIVEGEIGRKYMEKYLHGIKKVDTNPTTIVEFIINKTLKEELFKIQHKVEDGVISMGLGIKAGNGLNLFNNDLINKKSTYRIVTVKRH
jgi:hypothetical protein